MKIIFLLGGYDLEMLTIRQILDDNNIAYIDKKLSWGARLSSYNDTLNNAQQYDKIYGIELDKDITTPSNYIEIDHHGKNDNKVSSLEQIAKILNIKLSRCQQLIAANDSRYIEGMKAMGASHEEIIQIRQKERYIQDVSPEDEKKAQELVQKSDNNIIHTRMHKLIAINDFAYLKYRRYVVYNDFTIFFYFYPKEIILNFLKKNNIAKEKYFHGGGKSGFVGIKSKTCTYEQIQNLIERFKEMQKKEKETIYSYHTFMLPFIVNEEFSSKGNWECRPFEIETAKDYNEYMYFYKHVQDALFNKDCGKPSISQYYEYNYNNGAYRIESEKGIYELQLDRLSLRIFNTGVGILSFHLKNTRYYNRNDILAINDFGRRIYPQFLGKDLTKDTKKSILAHSITLTIDQKEYKEDFSRFNTLTNIKKDPFFFMPLFIQKLLENNFQNFKSIKPIIDDRMFVISQYNNDSLSNSLKILDTKERYTYEADEWWYKYIFVDGDSKTCQSKYMTQKLIKESTYDRWVEQGTLFGISRYSFVAVAGCEFGNNILLAHTQTMYFQIFSLLLAYRASVIKFSDEIQDITSQTNMFLTNAQKLYKKYLNFLNKLYFREVTAQEQGIELYNQAVKVMDIDKYMKDIDSEINELHSYVSMLDEKKRNKQLDFISKLGGSLLPLSIVVGFFGMNVGANTNFSVWIVCLLIILSILFYPVYQKFFKKD